MADSTHTSASDEDSDAAMREMMGFSSFGGSGAKSRKEKDKVPNDTGVGIPPPPLTGANATIATTTSGRHFGSLSEREEMRGETIALRGVSSRGIGNGKPVAKRAKMKIDSSSSQQQQQQKGDSSQNGGQQQTERPTGQSHSNTSLSNPVTTLITPTRMPIPASLIPASLPPISYPLAPGMQPQTSPPPPTVQQVTNTQASQMAFTSPHTNISFSRADLDALARGAGPTNSRGDKIYFKPGFVVEDPWARVRVLLEERKNHKPGGGRGGKGRSGLGGQDVRSEEGGVLS